MSCLFLYSYQGASGGSNNNDNNSATIQKSSGSEELGDMAALQDSSPPTFLGDARAKEEDAPVTSESPNLTVLGSDTANDTLQQEQSPALEGSETQAAEEAEVLAGQRGEEEAEEKSLKLDIELESPARQQEDEKPQDLSILTKMEEEKTKNNSTAENSLTTSTTAPAAAAAETKGDGDNENDDGHAVATATEDQESEAEDPELQKQAEIAANLLQDVLGGKVVEDLHRDLLASEDTSSPTSSSDAGALESESETASVEVEVEETTQEESTTDDHAEAPAPLKSENKIEQSVSVDTPVVEKIVEEERSRPEESTGASLETDVASAATSATKREDTTTFDARKIGLEIESERLVAEAIRKGEDPGENWELYGAMHRQATHDEEVFKSLLSQLIRQYEEEIEDILGDLKRVEGDKSGLEEKLESLASEHKRNVRRALDQAEVAKLDDIKKQREDNLRWTAGHMVRERQIRLKQLDDARLKLNALKVAFAKRSNETNLSHDSHKLTMAVLSIKDKTDQGLPFSDALDMLSPLAQDDEFIATILSSIPSVVAKEGAMTTTQLLTLFWETEKAAGKVALLPTEGAGFLSKACSHIASYLRVREDDGMKAESSSIESTFSVARRLVSERKFFECAALLEEQFEGTAAKDIICEWTKAARQRAIVDQAVKVLEASATAKAKSLT
jgi:hypothetical protein